MNYKPTYTREQCDQIWRNFATLAKLALGKFLMFYFVFGKIVKQLWHSFFAIGSIVIAVNRQILNK